MHPLLAKHQEQIGTLCRRHAVRRLDAFGSILRQDFDPAASDVDLVAEFDEHGIQSGLRGYFAFKQALESLLQRPVDLVELEAMPDTRLKRLIERDRQPIYATAA